jgi:hypothetical protein
MLLVGCEVEKSSNPLSPLLAGPIEGVVISAPSLLEPGQDWEIRSRDQPLKMTVSNAGSNSSRPLKYSFDIATDSAFKNVVFARTGIEPNSSGVTQFQLPDKLAAGTYWWRSRADDGANASAYSSPKSFSVLADVTLAAPTPTSPIRGATVPDLTPVFTVRGGSRSGLTGGVEYTLQVSNNSAFTSIAATFVKGESMPETRFDTGYSFLYGKTYYWRVRARHTGEGSEFSAWSGTQTFKTPDSPAAPPPSDGGGGSGGGGGGGDVSKCNSSDGPDIADCIEGRYPSRLASGVSLSTRRANMQFLRDKMIEHGKCRGLDLGLNLKRGGPEISVDFLVWRRPGKPDMGVDVGSAWDDTSRRLGLSWHTYDPPNYGHPYYKSYGPASCS